MTHLVRHASGRSLLAQAGAALEEREAENNLLLGICHALGDSNVWNGAPAYLASVHDAERTVAAAVCTPPHNVVVTRATRDALVLLRDDLRATGVRPPGIAGPRDAAIALADLLADPGARTPNVAMRQGIYQLVRVIPPPSTGGAMRAATGADEPLVVRWAHAFVHDSHLDSSEVPAIEASARRTLHAGRLVLWEDGSPVCMAAAMGRTSHGVRVSLVYTPPEHRRRGYAAATVAALSQRELDRGARFCFLYTDLDNPTSNRVYQRIGYEQVAEAAIVLLDPGR